MKIEELRNNNARINDVLILQDNYYENPDSNIDHLLALASLESELEKQKTLIETACFLVEKFHSFFHFEQSYFCTKYGRYLLENQRVSDGLKYLGDAIFQDHVNSEAHFYYINNIQKDQQDSARKYASSMGVVFEDGYRDCKRPYEAFYDYVKFATGSGDSYLKSISLNGFFYENSRAEDYEAAITDISLRHKKYHNIAGKIYVYYGNVLQILGRHELSKNAYRKAGNLDPVYMKLVPQT